MLDDQDTFWLFVYGSLKVGACNYDRVALYVRGVQPARVHGRLYLRADGYPALVPDERGPSIAGELFELGAGARARRELDAFEGSEYKRLLVPVLLESGESVRAWVYVCDRPHPDWPSIESWPPPGLPTPQPYTGSG